MTMSLSKIALDLLNFLRRCGRSFSQFAQWFFRTLGIRTKTKVAILKIKEETIEHIDYLKRILSRLVLPVAMGYTCLGFFLGKNVVDSLFFSIVIFVYSSFLPDLLTLFRTKDRRERRELEKWYVKYMLLFFAPVFVLLILGNEALPFRTMESFHNVKSLGVYSSFLLLLGFVFYGSFPLSSGSFLEVLSLALFGAIGYVAHLRVDKIL